MATVAARTRQIVNDVIAAWNAHDSAGAARYCAAEYEGVNIGEAEPRHGPEGMRRGLEMFYAAFPDLHFAVREVLIEDERAVVVWAATGTHQGRLMRIPPTGWPVLVRGMSLFETRDDKLVRGLHVWDMAGLLRNLRLLPELRPADE